MRVIRQYLARILYGCLLCQLAVIVAPLALTVDGTVFTREICLCPGSTPGATCPMHQRERPVSESASRCAMKNPCAPPDAALGSLSGAAVLTELVALQAPTVQITIRVADVQVSSRTDVPDSPPPRVSRPSVA
jgi:hypothetical protein